MESNRTRTKRAWRERNPERSREAERVRAAARRAGYWGELTLGVAPRRCASAESYFRYENSTQRFLQRTFWPRHGAGTTKMTDEEFRASGDAFMAEVAPEIRRISTLSDEEVRQEFRRYLESMRPAAVLEGILGAKATRG
jgi:hypothetical protein